jgi:hypothetical protein
MRFHAAWFYRYAALPAITLLLYACGGGGASPTAAPPAATATSESPTAPASPVAPTATETPLPPTATPSPTPDVAATAAANATATGAPMVAKIDSELKRYNLSTDQGHLGWLHAPYTVSLDSYLEEDDHTDYPDVTASDYVMQADITWDTTSGVAGCGFIMRAAPNIDHGDSYRLYLIRLGPLWDIEYYKQGKFYANLTGFRDALPLDGGVYSTNTVTVVVQGIKLAIYANGEEMDTIADTRLSRGQVAFITWQESGRTTCTFENGWLWILKD